MASSSRATDQKKAYRTELRVVPKEDGGRDPKGSGWLIGLLLVIAGFSGYHLVSSSKKVAPGIVETLEGEIALSAERQAKLERELEEIDNAIQYALVAIVDGEYPCLSCPFGLKTISLAKGNIWKYGVTRKGQAERYPGGNYGAENLLFLPMFKGTYSECLKEEKRLIYSYPLLPESAAREIVLARPPGNTYDR